MTTRLLALVLVLAALLFGGVEAWSSSLVLVLVFTLGLVWVLRREMGRYDMQARELMPVLPLLGLMVFGLVRIVPLPPLVVEVLSPAAHRIYSYYSVGTGGPMPLSLDPYRTTMGLLDQAAFLIVFVIVWVNGRGRGVLREMMTYLVVAGFCISLFAVIQKAAWNGSIYWFREMPLGGSAFGPFVNRNHFAGFVGMLVPLGLGVALAERQREKRVLLGFLTVIMALALCLSLSRGGITAFFASLALFAFLTGRDRLRHRGLWVVGIFLAVVLTYLLYLGIEPLVERFHKTDVTSEERLSVWLATARAVADYRLMGSGPGTFIDLFPLYAPAGIRTIYDHAHNDYLEFVLENGAVGALLLLGFCVLFLRVVWRSRAGGRYGILRAGALSSVLYMAVHSIFDFNLHILSNLLLFACVLGMAAGLSHDDGNDTAKV